TSAEDLEYARQSLAKMLSEIYGVWAVDGRLIKGRSTLAFKVEDIHQCGSTHVDIGFILNRDLPECPILWDCVAGLGIKMQDGQDLALKNWTMSTLPVFLELLVGDGSFAEHFHTSDADACPGWHVIHGPVLGFGLGDAPNTIYAWNTLQAWTLNN